MNRTPYKHREYLTSAEVRGGCVILLLLLVSFSATLAAVKIYGL